MNIQIMSFAVGEGGGSIFQMKLLGFMRKAKRLLSTELVRQCRNILPLVFGSLRRIYSWSTLHLLAGRCPKNYNVCGYICMYIGIYISMSRRHLSTSFPQ